MGIEASETYVNSSTRTLYLPLRIQVLPLYAIDVHDPWRRACRCLLNWCPYNPSRSTLVLNPSVESQSWHSAASIRSTLFRRRLMVGRRHRRNVRRFLRPVPGRTRTRS